MWLCHRPESLNEVVSTVRKTSPSAVLETFATDTSKASLEQTFQEIQKHQSFKDLKLNMAIYSIKHSSKKPFLEETREAFEESLETYVGGAFTFAQESLKRFFADHGEKGLAEGGDKKGVGLRSSNFCNPSDHAHRHSSSRERSVHSAAVQTLQHMELVAHQYASLRKHLRAR